MIERTRTRAAVARFVMATLVLTLFVPATLALAQSTRDATALLGYWSGGWKSPTGSGGHLSVSVDAVDGDNVRGVLFMAVTTPDTQGYYNRDVRVFGVFDGR